MGNLFSVLRSFDFHALILTTCYCLSVLGESSTDEPLEVRAFVGLDVVLPCKQHLPKDTEVPTVEWSKPDLKPSPYVFVYRQNFEVYDEKHPDYESRTHLFMKQVQYGNFSMRLSNVRKEDAGIYICKTIWNPNRQDDVKLKLVVGKSRTKLKINHVLLGKSLTTNEPFV